MSKFITYKNAKIHFTDQGRGSAVVLLHGFLESLNMWDQLIPHLVKKHRVIAIDLLGHGKSEGIGYIHTMEIMSEAVREVLRHLRLRRVIVVGHSMGGYVSLAFAETYPSMIKGLCLMNSTAFSDSPEKKKNRDRAIEAVKQNHKTFVRLALPNLFADHNRSKFKSLIKSLIKEALNLKPQAIVAALEGMKQRPDRSQLLKDLKVKKMIIVGKKDPVLDYKAIKKLAKNSHSELIEFPDGHMSHIENKEVFSYILLHFIEK